MTTIEKCSVVLYLNVGASTRLQLDLLQLLEFAQVGHIEGGGDEGGVEGLKLGPGAKQLLEHGPSYLEQNMRSRD